MDDATFVSFLQEQRNDLADIELILYAWQKRQADPADSNARPTAQAPHPLKIDPELRRRFDTGCRRLADAYMTGSEEQRTQIRALLRKMTGTRDSMGIPFTEIRHKIDAARFRLALIYESMKDLAEDTRDARTTIEELCRAARLAGIDPDPPLREVAAVSSEIDHHGMGSMKALLLERMTGGGARISCRVCGNSHESILAGCPICASRGMSWQSGAATRSRENQQDVLEQGVGEDESLIYLPTRQLLGFTILGLAAIYFLWATAIDIFRLVWGDELNPNWYYPKLVVQIAAFLLLWVFRFDRMIRKYSTKRRELRLGVTWKQSVLLVVLFWAILGVTVWLLATFGQRLGL